MIIDAHHHLWRFEPSAYAWIGSADTALRRDFLLPELTAMAAAAELAGTVAVQARQSLAETAWLLGLAGRCRLIRGVVGWVPLADRDLPAVFDALPPGPLRGVRHVVQGEADPVFLLRPEIQRGLAEVGRRGLAYDLLIRAGQLGQASACVERLPGQRFILDHGGKPDIRGGGHATWARGIATLARHAHVACKLSGLVTEADPSAWTFAQLEPYARTILDAFGPQRVLFGSDWPVCLLGTGHRAWLDGVRGWLAGWSDADRAAVLGGNAITWYRLDAA